MVMPGDACEVRCLLRKPMVIREGQRFMVREQRITSITGIITELLPVSEEKISGFNFSHPKTPMIQSGARSVVAKRRKK